MERWIGRVALVTGASAGIGAATAFALAKHGMKVVGCSRHPERIQELAEKLPSGSGSLEGVKCDVGNEDEILKLFEHIESKYGGVDVCINNAGLAKNAPLLSGSIKDWKLMLDVNILGLVVCTREAVNSMKKKGVDDGHIINVCSMSGHRSIGSKVTNFYGATKFAVRAITEGTRAELREEKSHIRISELSPGLVETEFFDNFLGEKQAKNLLGNNQTLKSEDMADSIIYMLSAPPHVQVHDILVRSTEQVS